MKLRKYLPLIGIGIFIYILSKLNLSIILQEIKNANPSYLLISLIFTIFVFVTLTTKWLIIAYSQKIYLPFSEAFKINLISYFYGFITPSKLGTSVRAEYLKKYTKNIGKGLSNFVLDKLLDVVSLLLVTIFFVVVFKDVFYDIPINLLIILLIVIILSLFIFINKKRSEKLLRVIYHKFVPFKFKKKAKLTFHSFYEDMPKKRYFILFLMLNILSWITTYIVIYLIGKSLGINLPLIYFLAILPISTLVSLIPITINGLGTREASLISLFGIFGVSAEKVFAMSMLNLFITGILPSIIAVFLIVRMKEK